MAPIVRGPLNSSAIPEAQPVAGVFNVVPPSPQDTQGCALQVDANGNLKVVNEAGGVASIVQIEDTFGNPLNSVAGALNVNVVAGGGSVTVVQPTAANLNATVVGAGTATAPSGGVLTVQGPLQTGNAPAAATVGASSGVAVAANASRTGLALVNTSANIISIGFGTNAAVLYSGVTLYPAGSLTLDIFDGCQQAITAIASSAGSNLAIQETQ